MPRQIHGFVKLPHTERTHCDTTKTKPLVNTATIINRITRVATETYTSKKTFIDQADSSLARTVRPTLLMNATDSVRLSAARLAMADALAAANDECTDQEQKQRIGEIQRDDNQTNEIRVHIRIHFRNELNSQ